MKERKSFYFARSIVASIHVPKRFLFISLLSLILGTSPALSEAVSPGDVGAAVSTWIQHVDPRSDLGAIAALDPYAPNGEVVAYVAHFLDGGFALCGADTAVLPVYLYVPEGKFDPSIPGVSFVLSEIGERTALFGDNGLPYRAGGLDSNTREVLQQRDDTWRTLISGEVPSRSRSADNKSSEPFSVKLNLTSRWSQSAPYNGRCPVLAPPSEHVPVGCTATAMAQLMYYWRWPLTGEGSRSVNYTKKWRDGWDQTPLANDPGITHSDLSGLLFDRLEWIATGGGYLRMNGYWDESLYDGAKMISDNDEYKDALERLWDRSPNEATDPYFADFAATVYRWDLMADTASEMTPEGEVAVAVLSHHVGVGAGIDYGRAGSRLSPADANHAVESYFRYDNDAYKEDDVDIDLMTEELLWSRPLLMSGFDEESEGVGHTWVVFGFSKASDPDRSFWVNLGWGVSPGLWTLDSIPPSFLYPSPFKYRQDIVVRLAPYDVVRFVGSESSGDGSPLDPHENIEEASQQVPDGGTLIFKAGSVNTFTSDSLVIDSPMILRGWDVAIEKLPE